MGVEQYSLVAHDWLNLEFIINDLASRVIGQELSPGSSPTFTQLTLSKTCLVAAGLNVLRVTGLQTDGVAMTGTLRGAYIDVSNGNTAATGTIRALELKARTEAPGDTGNDVNVLEGLSISADSKGHSVTTMRAAEFILDGKTGGTITEAVGLRIANNLQANKATTSYGLQIYRDSFDYTADIQLSSGGLIGGSDGALQIASGGGVTIQPTTDIVNTFRVLDADTELNVFQVDTLNHRVGINTREGPKTRFHVAGDFGTMPPGIAEAIAAFTANSDPGDDARIALIGGTNSGSCSFWFGDEDDVDAGYVTYVNRTNAAIEYMIFGVNTAEKMRIWASGSVNIGASTLPKVKLQVEGAFGLKELAAAVDDVAGIAQVYAKNDAPNTLWFVNDVGTEVRIAPQDLQVTASPTFVGGTFTSAGTTTITMTSTAASPNRHSGFIFKIAASSIAALGVDDDDNFLKIADGAAWWNSAENIATFDPDNHRVGINMVVPHTTLTVEGAITLKERAAAEGDTADYAQIWAKNTTPNQLWFRNDAGTDLRIAPQDLQVTATPTFNGLISTGIIQATDFAKTGWPITPGVTLSFVGGTTRTFTVTDDGSAYYYINGVKYVLGGNKTVVIDDTEGLWYIYFVGDTLTASQTIWSFRAEDKALVGYLYWARDVGTPVNGKAIFLGWEPHTIHMDGAIHARLHYAGGARWEIGLLVSDAGSGYVNVSAGDIWDEDLNIAITDDDTPTALFEQILSPARLPIYYRDGASAWRIYETNEKAIATDAGYVDISDDLKYNKLNGTWANATVGLNNYVAYWVVATNEQTEPVALIMGQRFDNKLSEAKENNIFGGLSLTGLPFEEMVVLARLILKDTGSGVFYTLEEVLDLRALNIGGNITSPLITQHAGLGGLNWANAGHTFDTAVDFNAQNISNIGTVGCGVITQSGTTLANTYQPLGVAVGFSSRCRVSMDSDQTVDTGNFRKLELDDIDYDNDSEWDTANKRFVVTDDGRYLVTAEAIIELISNERYAVIRIYVNGAAVNLGTNPNISVATTLWDYLHIADILELDENDFIEIWVYHNHGSDRIVDGVDNDHTKNVCAVHRIS